MKLLASCPSDPPMFVNCNMGSLAPAVTVPSITMASKLAVSPDRSTSKLIVPLRTALPCTVRTSPPAPLPKSIVLPALLVRLLPAVTAPLAVIAPLLTRAEVIWPPEVSARLPLFVTPPTTFPARFNAPSLVTSPVRIPLRFVVPLLDRSIARLPKAPISSVAPAALSKLVLPAKMPPAIEIVPLLTALAAASNVVVPPVIEVVPAPLRVRLSSPARSPVMSTLDAPFDVKAPSNIPASAAAPVPDVVTSALIALVEVSVPAETLVAPSMVPLLVTAPPVTLVAPVMVLVLSKVPPLLARLVTVPALLAVPLLLTAPVAPAVMFSVPALPTAPTVPLVVSCPAVAMLVGPVNVPALVATPAEMSVVPVTSPVPAFAKVPPLLIRLATSPALLAVPAFVTASALAPFAISKVPAALPMSPAVPPSISTSPPSLLMAEAVPVVISCPPLSDVSPVRVPLLVTTPPLMADVPVFTPVLPKVPPVLSSPLTVPALLAVPLLVTTCADAPAA